jgi:FtsZ-interacting cell division protein ZipA
MKLTNLKKTMAVSAFSLVALIATSSSAEAQLRNQGQQNRQQTVKPNQKPVQNRQPVVTQKPVTRRQNRPIQQQPTVSRNRDRTNTRQNTPIQQQPAVNRNYDRANRRQYGNQRMTQAQREQQIRLEQARRARIDLQRRYNQQNNVQYRVYRNGGYYQTDYRGAELLRQAVNAGYQQGFLAGQSDRNYRHNNSYNNSPVYRDGNYGYQSYVNSRQYQYYFQQGFEKGYEDGFNSRSRYGSYNNGKRSILSSVLSALLRIERY